MGIKIISKKNGFRRCGIEHPDRPVVYPKDRFTREQLKMLKEEPMLVVEEVSDEQVPGAEAGKEPPEESQAQAEAEGKGGRKGKK